MSTLPAKHHPRIDSRDSHVATRTALLEAAGRLFAEYGVEGTSVRDIIKAAGANLAAINYHFGTKERLALEVFAGRLRPVNQERLARLDAIEAAARGRRPKLAAVLEALIRPALESPSEDSAHCMRLMSRCFQEPNPELKAFIEDEFAEIARRFDAAIRRAVPGLSKGDLFWRLKFFFGALHYGQEMWLRFDEIPKMPHVAEVKRPDLEGFIRQFLAFATPGMKATEAHPGKHRSSPPSAHRRK